MFVSLKLHIILLTVFTISCSISKAQYPYRYLHLRNEPSANEHWQQCKKLYGTNNTDSALIAAKNISELLSKNAQWEQFLFIETFRAQIHGEAKQGKEAINILENAHTKVLGLVDSFSVEYIENIRLTARTYLLIKQQSKSFNLYQQCIRLLESSGKNPELLSYINFELGNIYMKKSYSEKERYYKIKALEALNNHNSPYSKILRFYITYSVTDRVQKGMQLELLHGVIRYCDKFNFNKDYLYFESLQKLANLYSLSYNNNEQAIKYLKQAKLFVYTNNYNKARQYNINNRLGDLYRKTQQYDSAEHYLLKAKNIAKNSYTKNSSHYLLSGLYLSRLYRNMKQFEKAENILQECYAIGETEWGNNFPRKSMYLGELGQLYTDWGKFNIALNYIQQRLFFITHSNFKNLHELPKHVHEKKFFVCYNTLVQKLDIYQKLLQSNPDQIILQNAINHCIYTDSLLQTVNNHTLNYNDGIANSERMKIIANYASYFYHIAYKNKNNKEYLTNSLNFIESASANYLKYIINKKEHKNTSINTPTHKKLLELESTLQSKASLLHSNDLNAYKDSITIVKAFMVQEYYKNNAISTTGINNNNINFTYYDIDKILRQIPENTMLLYLNNNNDSILDIYTIRKNTINYSNWNSKNIYKIFSAYKRALVSSDFEHIEKYESLIAKKIIRPHVSNCNKLIIIGNEHISQIPFENIIYNTSEKNNKIQVVYHYSLELWFNSFLKSNKKAQPQLLTVCPVFKNNENTNLTLRQLNNNIWNTSKTIPYLPQTNIEAAELKKQWDLYKFDNTLLSHENANERQFIEIADTFDIIHIATHGFSSKANPNNSGLILHQNLQETEYDNILYINELYQLNLNADLVVLSACKTGTGKIIEGEGVMALPRGFIYAGVPNVIASLWKVHDEKTKDLMVAFYKHLLEENVSYAEALRLAKLDCIEKGFLPVDWAGFVLIGN